MASATTSCKRKANKRRRKACRRKGKNVAERFWTDREVKPRACRYCRSSSASVEMTAYMAATLVMLDKMGKAKPSVKWLGGQRNSQGGFVSTQDTIVALQAISLYSQKVSGYKMKMDVLVTKGKRRRKKLKKFSLNEKNKLLLQVSLYIDSIVAKIGTARIPCFSHLQRLRLNKLPSKVSLNVTGSGCVLVQTVLRWNIDVLYFSLFWMAN